MPSLDFKLIKKMLPDHYTVKVTDKGYHCQSKTGMSDELFQTFFVTVKNLWAEDFQEIFHNVNSDHKDFTLYVRRDKVTLDGSKRSGEMLYRLEYNEKQQHFHLDNYTHEPNTHGWFTIVDYCSDLEFKIFESYVAAREVKPYTKEFLLQCLSESKQFLEHLIEYGVEIKFNFN